MAPITSELRSAQDGFKQYQRAERQIQEIKYTEEVEEEEEEGRKRRKRGGEEVEKSV